MLILTSSTAPRTRRIGDRHSVPIEFGYRDPKSINVESYANREDEGVLLVRKAGEMLYRLKNPPTWAKGS